MFKPDNKLFTLLFVSIFFAGLCFAIIRDIKNLEDGYSCDLRKRIVGSRYQAAGLSPYYYKWKPGQPEQFCNPYESGNSFKENVVTLAPSYLWLLQPLAKLPFFSIGIIWFIIQYLLLISIFGVFLFQAKKQEMKIGILLVFCLFLFSKGWILNIDIGQSYMVFPLLWTLGYFINSKKINSYFAAGIILAICCWLRPVCGLMILPFLISLKRVSFLKGFVIAGGICLLQVFLFHQYNNWIDFFHAASQWTSYFNNWGNFSSTDFGNGPWPSTIEGQSDFSLTVIPQYTANLPILIAFFFNIHVSPVLYICVFSALVCLILFVHYKKRFKLNAQILWLSAFSIYYLGEFFAAVPKPSYYFVELIFPILIIINLAMANKNKLALVLLFAGLIFETLIAKSLPMQLLIGEYLIFLSILVFIAKSLWDKKLNNLIS
jgi:hypothetical protein